MGLIGDGLEVIKLANAGANADLFEKLGKFVAKAAELQGQVDSLKSANRELEKQLEFKGTFIRSGGYTFVEGDDEAVCSRCAEVDCRPVHIVFVWGTGAFCPQCKAKYTDTVLRSSLEQRTKHRSVQTW